MSIIDNTAIILDKNLYKYRFHLLWTACLITIIYGLASIILGDPIYPLKDILLNYADGMIRRGLGGSIMIELSHIFGGQQPAFWAWLFASFITGLNCWLAIGLYKKLPDNPAYLPLVLAPYGIMAPAYDIELALRKEILGYLAILLILKAWQAGQRSHMLSLLILGMAVFLCSLFVHEAIIFMWPVFVLALWFLSTAWPQERRLIASIALLTGAGGVAIVAFLFQLPLPDQAKLCEAARIVICNGPFDFIGLSLEDGKEIFLTLEPTLNNVIIILCIAIFCLYPMSSVRINNLSRTTQNILVLIVFAATIPLYYVAHDWGRWLMMTLYPLSLIVIVAISEGYAVYETPLSPKVRVACVATLSIPHGLSMTLHFMVRGIFILPAMGVIALVCQCTHLIRESFTKTRQARIR